MEEVNNRQLEKFLGLINKGQISKNGMRGIIDRASAFNALGELVGDQDFTIQPGLVKHIEQIYLRAFELEFLPPLFHSSIFTFCRLLFSIDIAFADIKKVISDNLSALSKFSVPNIISEFCYSSHEDMPWFPGVFIPTPVNFLFFEELIKIYSVTVGESISLFDHYHGNEIEPGFILYPRFELTGGSAAESKWQDFKVRPANAWELLYLSFLFEKEKEGRLIRSCAKAEYGGKVFLFRIDRRGRLVISELAKEEDRDIGVFPIVVLS